MACVESLPLLQEIGDTLGVALIHRALGQMAMHLGHYEVAKSAFEVGLTATRELGDKVGIATELSNLGDVAMHQGKYADALTFYEQSLEFYRAFAPYPDQIPYVLRRLGHVALAQGDQTQARTWFVESLMAWHMLGQHGHLAGALVLLR